MTIIMPCLALSAKSRASMMRGRADYYIGSHLVTFIKSGCTHRGQKKCIVLERGVLPHIPKEYMWGSYSLVTEHGIMTVVPGRPPEENF